MHIQVIPKAAFDPHAWEYCLAVPVFEQAEAPSPDLLAEADQATLQRLLDRGVVTGKVEEPYFLLTPQSPTKSLLLLGVGRREAFDAEALRRSLGKACELLHRNRVTHLAVDVSGLDAPPFEALIEGILLGQYSFDPYKDETSEAASRVYVEELFVLQDSEDDLDTAQQRCDQAVVMALNTNWARDLANAASNDLTPAALAEQALALADEVQCQCEILSEDQLTALGMNALLGVARGSAQSPRLIVLRYEHVSHTRTVALVGKGITFDTGGISLKPRENMHEMKYDMCGAAAVLGAMKSVCQLAPTLNVLAAVPAAENLPGPAALKPGDIVKTYSGKTVEVHNTDAEGRLVLADTLAYLRDVYHPACMVDVATLTGACVAALGHYAAAIMANDDGLSARLRRASEKAGERLWPLPLWDDYSRLIEGTHADLCNIGPPGEAGAITGGCFLKAFVGDTPWAHIDIAGTAWGVKHIPYLNPKHATGFGVRTLTHWILDEANA